MSTCIQHSVKLETTRSTTHKNCNVGHIKNCCSAEISNAFRIMLLQFRLQSVKLEN